MARKHVVNKRLSLHVATMARHSSPRQTLRHFGPPDWTPVPRMRVPRWKWRGNGLGPLPVTTSRERAQL